MLDLAGLSGDGWVSDYRAKVAAATNREAAFEIMDELVCRLNDYHTRFSWLDKPRLVSPPLRVEPVLAAPSLSAGYGLWGKAGAPQEVPALDGVAIAVVQADSAGGVKIGDEIESVDGVAVREALERTWPHSVGSSAAGKLRAAADRMLLGAPDTELKLRLRRQLPGGNVETITVSIPRTKGPGDELVSRSEVDGVPVIRITRWSNRTGEDLIALFDKMLEEVRSAPNLIIDVRGNGGG